MNIRPRINRWTKARRDLNFDVSIKSSLVQPHFVVDGEGIDEPISSMPGINRQSVDKLLDRISKDMEIGINSHMIFPVLDSKDKDSYATKASNLDMPLQIAVKKLKSLYGGDIVIMTDVCLCTATDHGHCGIIHDEEIDNEMSVSELPHHELSHNDRDL